MTQRNEKELVEARKMFYQNREVEEKLIMIGVFAGKHVSGIMFSFSYLNSIIKNSLK